MKLWCLLPLLGAFLAQESEGTYTDEERGFSIPIPKGWSVIRAADKSPCLSMKAPPETRTGATLILHIQDPQKEVAEGTLTLDKVLEEAKKQYAKRFQDFEWDHAEKGKDGDIPTLTIYYRYTYQGQKIGQLQHLLWTRKQHYSLSWGCRADAFEANRETFEKCSKAFKLLPGKK
jgi:hypothetical protein